MLKLSMKVEEWSLLSNQESSTHTNAFTCLHRLPMLSLKPKPSFVILYHFDTVYIMKSDDPASYSNEDKLYDVNQIKSAMENKDEIVVSVSGHQTLTLESLKFIKCHTFWGKHIC